MIKNEVICLHLDTFLSTCYSWGSAPHFFYFLISKTIDDVIVDHADGLHEGVADSGADKVESAFFQIFTESIR